MPAAAADALTFAGRDGARRRRRRAAARATGGTLTMTSAPFAPRGLFDSTPTVLAMRALPVDPELVCDLVVEASELVAAADDAPTAAASRDRPRAVVGRRVAAARRVGAARERRRIRRSPRARSGGSRPSRSRCRRIRVRMPCAPCARRSGARPTTRSGGLPLGVAFAAFTLGFIVGEEDAARARRRARGRGSRCARSRHRARPGADRA